MGEQFAICEHNIEYEGGCKFTNVIFTDEKSALDYVLENGLLDKVMIYKLTPYLHNGTSLKAQKYYD